jgi:hypothetical protein
MKTLKDLLPKRPVGDILEVLDEKTVFFVCKRVIVEEYGVRGGENIIPNFYGDKKLFLAPRSSLWSSEIWLQREHIRKRMNEMLGSEAIVEVKISQQQ